MALDLTPYNLTGDQTNLYQRLQTEFPQIAPRRVLQAVCAKKTYEKCVASLPALQAFVEQYDMDTVTLEEILPIVGMCELIFPPLTASHLCQDGSVATAMKYKDWDPKRYDLRATIRGWMGFVEILLAKYPAAVTGGVSFICDCEGMGWSNFDPEMEKIFVQILQDTYPIRMKGFFMVNSPTIIKAIMMIMKPFMGKKMKDRLKIIHKEDLLKYMPRPSIPVSLRGELNTTPAACLELLR